VTAVSLSGERRNSDLTNINSVQPPLSAHAAEHILGR
jgi:hypothetical protein